MTIAKHIIVSALRARSQDARADWVEREMPDEIDPAVNTGLFATLNLSAADLMATQNGTA